MNTKLVDSLVKIITSLTEEEQMELQLKISDYKNTINSKQSFDINPLKTMQPYAFLANPSEPVIPEDEWEINQDVSLITVDEKILAYPFVKTIKP